MLTTDAAVFAARNGASRKCKLASATNGVNFKREFMCGAKSVNFTGVA
nr:hypothetical protein [uncultured Campylobacter sp.]